MKIHVASIILILAALSQSASAYTYGCGFIKNSRIGVCHTYKTSSEALLKQVAVMVTSGRGENYDFGGSGYWSKSAFSIEQNYKVGSGYQQHFISGQHCVQYYNETVACNSSSHSQVF